MPHKVHIGIFDFRNKLVPTSNLAQPDLLALTFQSSALALTLNP